MAALSVPIVSFGLVADPQFKSNAPDGNVEGRVQRYSEVPAKLEQAVADWAAHAPMLELVLNLGDTIDGRETVEQSEEDLELMAKIFDGLGPVPQVHVIGNHCLAVPRERFIGSMKLPSSYYSRPLAPEWRLVVLDTTDLCTGSGWPEGSPQQAEAQAYLQAHAGEPNMVDWNGGLGAAQMEWLRKELAAAEHAGEKVVVAAHHPIGAGSGRPTHMAWNWAQVQEVLVGSKSVVLCLSGHDHPGGYACIQHVHFVTVEAMLEAPPGSNAYATVRIYQDHIEIKGVGSVTSRKLVLPSHLVSV